MGGGVKGQGKSRRMINPVSSCEVIRDFGKSCFSTVKWAEARLEIILGGLGMDL